MRMDGKAQRWYGKHGCTCRTWQKAVHACSGRTFSPSLVCCRAELHTVATATVVYSHRPLSQKRLSQVKADVYRLSTVDND